MGEISFNYKADIEPAYEAAFKYWFSESIEYSFAYQRYIAFSDASIFNSPVAITKVASGLFDLQELFAERTFYFEAYSGILNGCDKQKSNAFIKQGFSGKSNVKHGNINKTLTGINYGKDTNKNKDLFSEIDRKKINIYQDTISQNPLP